MMSLVSYHLSIFIFSYTSNVVKIGVIKKHRFFKKTYLFIYSSKKHRLSDSQPQKSRYKDTKVDVYPLVN